MSDEGEFAERWSAPRDAASASVPDDNDASTGPLSRLDEVEPGVEQPDRLVFPASAEASEYGSEPQASYGTEPQPYDTEPQASYGTEPQPYDTEPQPYSTEPQPYSIEPQPYSIEPQPYSTEPQPYSTELQASYGTEPQPYSTEPQPYSIEPQPYGTEPQPYSTEPQASYGTEPQPFTAWETSDSSDSLAEGRVVFSTPTPEDRLDFSLPDPLPDHDVSRGDAAETPAPPAEGRLEFSSSDYLAYDVSRDAAAEAPAAESVAPAEGRLEFSSSDYLTYDLSQAGAAETSVPEPVTPEDRLDFSSSDYLTYDVSQAGASEAAAPEPAAPAEDRLEFSSSSYLSYDSYDVPSSAESSAEVPAAEPVAPAEGRLEFSSSYLSYDRYDVSRDDPAEAAAAEPATPAEGRLEFSAPEYLTYDVSPAGAAEAAAVPDPPAPIEDRPASYSSEYPADVSTPSASWEGSLFDGDADTEAGDERYVPATPSGPGTPPKPGTPSSGNLRLPDWMREESGYGRHAAAVAGRDEEEDDDEPGRSRFALFAVVALVVALVLAGGVYFLRSGGDEPAATPPADAGEASTGAQPAAEPRLPARKALRRFPGTPSVAIGRFADVHAGLSYPRFGTPWQAATKQNRLAQLGWSGQQVVVTEQRGSQLWYGQVLSGTLGPGEMSMYGGPGTEEATAAAYAKHVEERFYGFPHRSRPFASQPLIVSGHKGWLVSSYLQYRRPGIRATGELVVAAVVDTGRPSPAVLFMAIPNTHRELWPDVNYFLTNLRVVG